MRKGMKRRRTGASSEDFLALSYLLAPSVHFEGEQRERVVYDPPSEKYITARKAEGKPDVERKPLPPPDPINASVWSSEIQWMYVKAAAKHGDWRALRRTKPTELMLRIFPTARAKYLAWIERHKDDSIAILPEVKHERHVCSLKGCGSCGAGDVDSPQSKWPNIDTSRCCPSHGCKDCPTCTKGKAA